MLPMIYFDAFQHLVAHFLHFQRCEVAMQLSSEHVLVNVDDKLEEVEAQFLPRHGFVRKARGVRVYVLVCSYDH